MYTKRKGDKLLLYIIILKGRRVSLNDRRSATTSILRHLEISRAFSAPGAMRQPRGYQLCQGPGTGSLHTAPSSLEAERTVIILARLVVEGLLIKLRRPLSKCYLETGAVNALIRGQCEEVKFKSHICLIAAWG